MPLENNKDKQREPLRPGKTPEKPTEEARRLIFQKKRETIQKLVQSKFPGKRGERELRKFLETHAQTLRKAGIGGTKETRERQLRQVIFEKPMDRLTVREQQMIAEVSKSSKVDPNTIAVLRDMGVDGFGFAYDGMARKDVRRQLLDIKVVAESIKGIQKEISAVLAKEGMPPEKKREAIKGLIRTATKRDSIFEGVADILEKPNGVEKVLRELSGLNKGIKTSVAKGYRQNENQTYGYSRKSAAGEEKEDSPSFFKDLLWKKGSPERQATGKGKTVVNTIEKALTAKNVRGKHCWDWCEKIYKRAGVRQKNIYSNFKGPRSDMSKGFKSRAQVEKANWGLQPGDWIFVRNHNSSDKNGCHSVIFLGWEGNSVKTANCPRSGTTGCISSYDVGKCPIVWISRPV